ncbi:unnamed protein product [Strongylus vulgaris]|uniref:NR LBD domain-containing protein n=1 Tax=Strongylus vulgaris TaxID=40348 RepID=A0A3P7JEU9_STRVU|nr:unnamed protein product [Strongylus vulgaris]
MNLLDLLTLPCALENVEQYEINVRDGEVDWDEELSIQAEYAKTFQWFRELHIEEKLTLLVDRLFQMAAMRLAVERAQLDRTDIVSKSLRLTISAIRRIELDPVAFAILNAIVFTDYGILQMERHDLQITWR